VENSKQIVHGERTGLQFEMNFKVDDQEVVFTCRYFIAHGRFYQVLVGHRRGNEISAERDHFFEKFTLEPDSQPGN
jgi:hypothetical protein